MKDTISTVNHKEIKLWTEERSGNPSILKDPSHEASNLILRIHFGDKKRHEEDVKAISWNKFFEEFEKNQLAFVYKHDNFGGRNSNFHRFIFRDEIGGKNEHS